MACRSKFIRIDKSPHLQIVISAQEVVERGLSIVYIATVAQGGMNTESICHAAGGSQDLAPSVVGILNNCRAAGIQNGSHIALNVGGIVVVRTIVGDGHGRSGRIIGKVQGVTAHGHLAQATAIIDIAISGRAVGSLGSKPVCVVRIGPSRATIRHRCQLTTMLPGVGPSAITERIADLVIGDGFAVISGQQITPAGIAVGVVDCFSGCTQCSGSVGIFLAGQNVACIVVCPDPSLFRCLVILPEGLSLRDFGELLG